jgi:hypothetical protein
MPGTSAGHDDVGDAEHSPPYPRIFSRSYPALTSSTEGRIMRRREAGWGAAPRGSGLARPDTRAAAGLPPGSLRSPARSWLTTLGPKPNACDHFSRGAFQAQEWRGAGNGARVARGAPMAKAGPAGPTSRRCWRAERRPRVFGREPQRTALFGAPPPSRGTPLKTRTHSRRGHSAMPGIRAVAERKSCCEP